MQERPARRIIMGQAVTFSSSQDRPVPPVLVRGVLRLLQEAMLHSARLRVAAAPPPRSQLALLAEKLEILAGQMRSIAGLRA
jgi:hypothetical protein